jgi:hypothetical protein
VLSELNQPFPVENPQHQEVSDDPQDQEGHQKQAAKYGQGYSK